MRKKINILKKKYYISCNEDEIIRFLNKIILDPRSDRSVDYRNSFFVGDVDEVVKKISFTHSYNLGPTPDPDCIGSFYLKNENLVDLEIDMIVDSISFFVHGVLVTLLILLSLFIPEVFVAFCGDTFVVLLIFFDFKNQKRLMVNRFENQLRRYFSYSSEVVSKNRFL